MRRRTGPRERTEQVTLAVSRKSMLISVSSGKEGPCSARWSTNGTYILDQTFLVLKNLPYFSCSKFKITGLDSISSGLFSLRRKALVRYIYPHTTTEQKLFELPAKSMLSSSSKFSQAVPIIPITKDLCNVIHQGSGPLSRLHRPPLLLQMGWRSA